MAYAKLLKVGQRVGFTRLQDGATKLTGKIVATPDDGLVQIQTEAGNGSASRLEEANPRDVTILEEGEAEVAAAAAVDADASADGSTQSGDVTTVTTGDDGTQAADDTDPGPIDPADPLDLNQNSSSAA